MIQKRVLSSIDIVILHVDHTTKLHFAKVQIITYNEAVDAFARQPIVTSKGNVDKALAYLDALTSRGGTNIHAALIEALRPKPGDGMLPIVLFLTDGLPTIGQTSEVAIRNVALKGNPHRRRVFTFGVGDDVNAPLLDKIALSTRATATYVLPGEDVEVKVAGVFKRLSGPVLATPALAEVGEHITKRLHQLLPGQLPDLFEGDQLIVLGQYTGEGDLSFELSGNYKGRQRKFNFDFDLSSATTRNAFVPRLWASRKIGQLVDAVRELGADADGGLTPGAAAKVKELTDEIVRLSTEFGILTEYTAFLARQGTDLGDREQVFFRTISNLDGRAIKDRSGRGAVIQSTNNMQVVEQWKLNRRNAYANDDLTIESITTVQQVNDRAFYQRGRRWVDSRAVSLTDAARDARVIEFGSEPFRQLLQRMVNEGRQGCLALGGEILLMVDGEPVLVKGPSTH